jgi:hypothetical protein
VLGAKATRGRVKGATLGSGAPVEVGTAPRSDDDFETAGQEREEPSPPACAEAR